MNDAELLTQTEYERFFQSVMLLGYYVAIHKMFDKSCDSSQVNNPLKAFSSMPWLQNRSL